MKKIFTLTEEEKSHILNLHKTATAKHYLSEQDDKTVTQQQTLNNTGSSGTSGTSGSSGVAGSSGSSGVAGSSGSSGVAGTIVNSSVKNLKVNELQNKLNEKFKSGLSTDSRWGPKTAIAVLNALKSLEVPQEVNSQQTNQTQEPVQYLPKLPAGTVQRPSQPTPLAPGNPINQVK